MNKIYISGPMTGHPEWGYPAFHAAEERLRGAGWEQVVNPATNFEGRTDLPRSVYMAKDVGQLLDCHAVFMLPGWQNSKGARLELALALELGMEVVFHEDASDRPPVEQAAAQLVRAGERQAVYGHPAADFNRTSAMWSAILGVPVSPQDVALMMACLKISRLVGTPGHSDSITDLIGYAICYDRVTGFEKGDEHS